MKTHYTNTTPDSKMIGDTKAWGKTEKVKRVVDDLMSGASRGRSMEWTHPR